MVSVVSASGFYATEHITSSGEISAEQDIEVTQSGHGLVLSSPNGTRWRIQVSDGGTLITTAI
jgi:hypothetical protein